VIGHSWVLCLLFGVRHQTHHPPTSHRSVVPPSVCVCVCVCDGAPLCVHMRLGGWEPCWEPRWCRGPTTDTFSHGTPSFLDPHTSCSGLNPQPPPPTHTHTHTRTGSSLIHYPGRKEGNKSLHKLLRASTEEFPMHSVFTFIFSPPCRPPPSVLPPPPQSPRGSLST